MTNIRLYEKPSLKRLAEIFFRIGNTTFGGGYVTIGMLGRELVDTRRWISSEKFDLAFALARVTPGTNIIAFCAAVGALIFGLVGAVVAVVALTAPSAVLAVLIVQGFVRYAAAWSNASLGLQALMAMVALSLLFIPAYAHHRYRRWSDSIVSGKRGRPTTSLSKATVSVAHLSRERANFRGRLLGSEQESEVARNSVEVSDSRPS